MKCGEKGGGGGGRNYENAEEEITFLYSLPIHFSIVSALFQGIFD
jgi:hypothetical protein